MADKGSNNWLWWSIGGIATLGLGLGIYYYVKSRKEEKNTSSDTKDTQPTSSTTSTPPSYTAPSTQPPSTQTYVMKSTPFTSVEQSNAFRKWVNEKDPAFAKEIDLSASATSASSMNNEYIQKAWGKYSDMYYTENANHLGYFMQLTSGAKPIDGGVVWKSIDSVPRGEVFMYTDGKISANAVNAQGQKTKYVQGGWYYSNLKYYIMIGGKNYDVLNVGLKNVFWTILKTAGIFNDSTNTYSSFTNADGRGGMVFGVNGGEGGIAQDLML